MDSVEKVLSPPGSTVSLTGEEALVRGLLEAGVSFATGYPGGPGAPDRILLPLLSHRPIHFEWSANEAVLAGKTLAAATLAHNRSFAFMKNIGLNVALDALFSMSIKDTYQSGSLIFLASDPEPSRSQTSQDNRYLLSAMEVPLLEPSTPQDALDFTRRAYELSEEFGFPFFIQMNPLVLEMSSSVRLGPLPEGPPGEKIFRRTSLMDFVTISYQYARDLERRKAALKTLSARYGRNFCRLIRPEGAARKGVLCQGLLGGLVNRLQEGQGFPVLILGMAQPLPREVLREFIRGLDEILVLEEGGPFLEEAVAALANEVRPGLKVRGRELRPEVGAVTEECVRQALRSLEDPSAEPVTQRRERPWGRKEVEEFFPLYLALHRVYEAPDKWRERETPLIVVTGTGNFGSYAIPHGWVDFKFHMGSSFSVAGGLTGCQRREGEKSGPPVVVAVTGDCSFHHSDYQGLLDNVYHQKPILHIICDNAGSAMTGGQKLPYGEIRDGVLALKVRFEEATQSDIVALSRVLTELIAYVQRESRPAVLLVGTSSP